MRFLADANVSRLVILRLRVDGHDVVSVSETFPPRTPDEQVLSAAQASDSILITEDRDFGELVIRQRRRVRGVMLLELDRLSNKGEADRVAEVVLTYADKLAGNFVVVEPTHIRVRSLGNC